MSQYLLAPKVFLARTDDYLVFLDLKRDKYIAIDPAATRLVEQLLPELASSRCGANSGDKTDDAILLQAAANTLLKQGLLTSSTSAGRPATPITIDVPTAVLVNESDVDQVGVRPAHVLRFFGACLLAAFQLRVYKLDTVVSMAHRRKELTNGTSAAASDVDLARELVAIFQKLRPLAYAVRNVCLFDSLALLHFLAGYQIHPTWVFGVKTSTGPFAAHTWLQQNGLVLNGTLETVRGYAPIMVL